MTVASDDLSSIVLQNEYAMVERAGETASFTIYSDDLMQERPELHIKSDMNQLLTIVPSKTARKDGLLL